MFIPERGEVKEENLVEWMRRDVKPRTNIEATLQQNYQKR